jgi:3-hydroxyisobutyrate dehydrogenase
MEQKKPTVGFIGTGVMGGPMAGHLLRAGYPLFVYNRTAAKTESLVSQGARRADSPADIAAESDVVITMVGFPDDVEHIYLGENGLVERAKPGALLIDMTTSSPELAVRIHEAAGRRGIKALDAPVSGGDIGARNAALSIMVGGDPDAFEEALPLLRTMGKTIARMGGPGAGQHTKMSNQIAIASCLLGVCEAIAYAEKAGLDPAHVIATIEHGAAASWTLSNLGRRIIDRNFAPGFYVKHFIKDMRIALRSAKALGLTTPGLELVLRMFEELAERGESDSGTQALYKWLVDHIA